MGERKKIVIDPGKYAIGSIYVGAHAEDGWVVEEIYCVEVDEYGVKIYTECVRDSERRGLQDGT